MKLQGIILKVLALRDKALVILDCGLEVEITLEQATQIKPLMVATAELCKGLIQKFCVEDRVIFFLKKNQILPKLEQQFKELALEAEDEKRMEIDIESNQRVANFFPLFKKRIAILKANDKSFMKLADWRKELRTCEIMQDLYAQKSKLLSFKKVDFLCLRTILGEDFYAKLDKVIIYQLVFMVNAFILDCQQGINPEDEESIEAKLFYSHFLKIPNIIGEEVRVADILKLQY